MFDLHPVHRDILNRTNEYISTVDKLLSTIDEEEDSDNSEPLDPNETPPDQPGHAPVKTPPDKKPVAPIKDPKVEPDDDRKRIV